MKHILCVLTCVTIGIAVFVMLFSINATGKQFLAALAFLIAICNIAIHAFGVNE